MRQRDDPAIAHLPQRRECLHRLATAGATAPLLWLAGCAAPVREARPPAAPLPADIPADEPGQEDLALFALGLVGIPYRWGGNTPEGGFDCSGLIGYVYARTLGLRLPRTVRELQGWGQPASADSVRIGDLAFFGRGAVATHAGIVITGRRFVHAPSTGGTVRLDRMDAPWWAARFMGLRRA